MSAPLARRAARAYARAMPATLAKPPAARLRQPAPCDGPRPHLFTVEEYYLAGKAGVFPPNARVELLEGRIMDMPPIGPGHSGKVNRLNRLFAKKLGDDYIVSPQNPVRLNDASEPEPDFAILKFRADCYEESHPTPADTLLLVEIAESSLDYDLTDKRASYAKAPIHDYWVVDLKARCVHVFSKPRAGKYTARRIAKGGDALTAAGLPGLSVRVSEMLV